MKLLHLALAALSFTVNVTGQVPVETERLIRFPTPPVDETRFSDRLAMTERWLFSTAPVDRGGVGGGAVYVYERQGGEYALNTILYPRALDTTSLRDFGNGGVSVAGNTLAVASSLYVIDASLPIPVEGRVHLYRCTGSTWALDTVLEVPDGGSLIYINRFGSSVAMSSVDEVLVGAPGDVVPMSNPPTAIGSIYRFRRDSSGQWRYMDKFFGPPPPSSLGGFGDFLDVHGDGGLAHGSAGAHGIVRTASGAWSLGYPIDVPHVGCRRLHSGQLNDSWLVIGDPQCPCDGVSKRSRVYVFERTATGWSLFQTLFPQDSYRGPIGSCNTGVGAFGYAIDLVGGRLAIGSPRIPDNGQDAAGQASIFEFDGTEWVETEILKAQDAFRFGSMGSSVSLNADTVAVGWLSVAPDASAPTERSGAVAIFELSRGVTVCPGASNSTGVAGELSVRGNSTATQRDVYLDAQMLPPGSFCLGLVSAQEGFVMNPAGSVGNLCLSGSIGRFIQQTGPVDNDGRYQWQLQDAGLPIPTGFVALQAGSSWVFQAWYRDAQSGQPTSNFTSAVRASFD